MAHVINGTDSSETLNGTTADDTIHGNGGDDIIIDNQGDDFLYGDGGNDTLTGGLGFNDFWGGTGNDKFVMTARTSAGLSDDLIHDFTHSADKIDVSAWGISDFSQIQRLLYTDNHHDAAFNAFFDNQDHVLRLENVNVSALTSSDFVYSTGGAINTTGTAQDDVLFGSSASDTINGGDGNDLILGGAGDDVLIGGAGIDNFDGGVGFDTVSYSYTNEAVFVNLKNQVVKFTDGAQESLVSIEAATGSGGNDKLFGNGQHNVLDGGNGNDIIRGGNGADTLTGGAGHDRFVYTQLSQSTVGASGRDTITDFSTGDHISLTQLENLTGENFNFIGSAAYSHAAGELRYHIAGGNTVVSLDVDGNGTSDFAVTLTGVHTLHDTDFFL